MTTDEMTRGRAIEIVDELNRQYAELCRVGRCPGCEEVVVWKEVEKHPDHELLDAMSGQEASEYLEWTSPHAATCSFMAAYQYLPALAAEHHIVIAYHQLEVPMARPDGKVMRDLVPVRVPAPGDPPVPD